MMENFAPQSLNTTHLYEQVADLMEQEIVGRRLDGERLPGEQALATRFKVSRASIREAMKLLRERGLVDSRQGSVSLVKKPEACNLSAVMSRIIRMDDIGYNDIYDMRILMELEAARLAASRVGEEDLKAMEAQLDLLKDRGITSTLRRDTDFAFHLQIAKAAGNQLLVILVEAMSNVFKDMINAGIFVLGGIDDAIMRHDKILKALQARDPEAAQTAMLEHLEQSRHHVAVYLKDKEKTKTSVSSSAGRRSEK